MSLLVALVIGVLVGGGAGFFLFGHLDLIFLNMLLGVAGSILGLAAFYLLAVGNNATASLFSGAATVCSILGAFLVVLTFTGIHRIFNGNAERRGNITSGDGDKD